MLEKYLIQHCSPTLASLKTANLFTYQYDNEKELNLILEKWNNDLSSKGIKIYILRKKNNIALVYVFRERLLEKDLQKFGVKDFLSNYGYKDIEISNVLKNLEQRINESDCFPHEIGIFLSYPLDDVIGFIVNEGKNSKCVGCWKVYVNECEALEKFEKYKRCTNLYMKLWNSGKSILQLSVAV